MKKFKNFFVQTFKSWWNDGPLSTGAALSFYTIVAFPALILSLLFITGLFLEKETLQTQLLHQANIFFGTQGESFVQQTLQNVPPHDELQLASIISIVVLFFGATGFFEQLEQALNKIWNIERKKNLGWLKILKNQGTTFLMVLGFGGVLIGTLFLEFIISFFLPYFQSVIPVSVDLVQTLGLIIGFCIMSLVFGCIYKYLPAVKIAWKDAWIGGLITALLFTLGKYLIGFYLSKSSIGSAYGAAGSLVIFLVWVYYSSQTIFLGAEFTKNYANMYGEKIKPNKDARSTTSWWHKILH